MRHHHCFQAQAAHLQLLNNEEGLALSSQDEVVLRQVADYICRLRYEWMCTGNRATCCIELAQSTLSVV